MPTALLTILFAVLAIQPAVASDAKPSEASVEELLTVMDVKAMTDHSWDEIDSFVQAGMRKQLGDAAVTADQQKILDDMRAKMLALYKEEMKWESLEPMFIAIYQKSLTQKEIDGMIEFYKTEAGKAVIAKMPILMRETMQAVQSRMSVLLPKLQQLAQDTAGQLKKPEEK